MHKWIYEIINLRVGHIISILLSKNDASILLGSSFKDLVQQDKIYEGHFDIPLDH